MINAYELKEYCNKRTNSIILCRCGCKYVDICNVLCRNNIDDKSNGKLILFKSPFELTINEINDLIKTYEEENKND